MKPHPCRRRAIARGLAAPALALMMISARVFAGEWDPVEATGEAPPNIGLMLLLPDGRVLVNDNSSTDNGNPMDLNSPPDWYILAPGPSGHYVDGTWTKVSSMHNTRDWFSSQVLTDGRVFVAGGEYGTGGATAEIYDPSQDPLNPQHDPGANGDPWTYINPPTNLLNPAATSPIASPLDAEKFEQFYDSTSETLPNDSILITPVFPAYIGEALIYNPVANLWEAGPNLQNDEDNEDEASFVKLPDNSILTIDPQISVPPKVDPGLLKPTSQRFIPSSNSTDGTWVTDSLVPVKIFDNVVIEEGPGILLPNGKAFFSGGTGHTVIYTPSGSSAKGKWVVGPDVPQNLAPDDAPCAMMNNGKVLCAYAPKSTGIAHGGNYLSPTSFFEYDYSVGATGKFTQVNAPYGNKGGPNKLQQAPDACNQFVMLDLPDGRVLCSNFSGTAFIYIPEPNTNATVASLVPKISSVVQRPNGSYLLTGSLLTGISEGAAYGDDAQMSSNYPIVSLTKGSNVYYARTYNWSTGVMQIGKTQTTDFDLPQNLPTGTYSLVVSANGLQSAPYTFNYSSAVVWADFNYGSTGSGSFTDPYSLLDDAINGVPSGGTIEFEGGGATSETLTISKPMNLFAYNGPVTIGNAASPTVVTALTLAARQPVETAVIVKPAITGSNVQLAVPHSALQPR